MKRIKRCNIFVVIIVFSLFFNSVAGAAEFIPDNEKSVRSFDELLKDMNNSDGVVNDSLISTASNLLE